MNSEKACETQELINQREGFIYTDKEISISSNSIESCFGTRKINIFQGNTCYSQDI